MNTFFAGAVWSGFWVVALFFLRFWTRTGERLFIIFAVAFFMMGMERVLLAATDSSNEFRPLIYIFRLLGFTTIAGGVIDKNWKRRKSKDAAGV